MIRPPLTYSIVIGVYKEFTRPDIFSTCDKMPNSDSIVPRVTKNDRIL